MTSSTLFSRKLEHIKANPRVSVSVTDPVGVGGRTDRATIQGDARVIEEDPHGGWERILPIWEAKEPAIVAFLKARVALPLFFERALIEITPARALYWADGDAAAPPDVTDRRDGGRVMAHDRPTRDAAPLDALDGLAGSPYPPRPDLGRRDGYPVSVAVEAEVDADGRTRRVRAAGRARGPDRSATVSLTGSHIRPQPGYGYDERRHVTVWGSVATEADGRLALRASGAWGWDEAEVPFFEYSERSVGQSRRYFDALSAERGTPVRPRLSFGWLALRTTRLPFLSATIVPVVLGIAIAASHGLVRPADRDPDGHRRVVRPARAQRRERRLRHAPRAPTTRTSRRRSSAAGRGSSSTASCRCAGWRASRPRSTSPPAAIGLVLLALAASTALLVIGVVGIVVSLGYTAPPLKLVYRGLGEVAVAIGFGPLMLLGAYVVQTGGVLTLGGRRGVAADRAARRADPLRQRDPRPARRRAGRQADAARAVLARAVITGYRVAAAAAFAIVVVGVVAGCCRCRRCSCC